MIVIWGQIILFCGGRPVHCVMFSSASGFYSLDVSGTTPWTVTTTNTSRQSQHCSKSVNLSEPQFTHLEIGYSNNISSQPFIIGTEKNLHKAFSIAPGTQKELCKGLLIIYHGTCLNFFWSLTIAMSSFLVILWTLECSHTVDGLSKFPLLLCHQPFPPCSLIPFLKNPSKLCVFQEIWLI